MLPGLQGSGAHGWLEGEARLAQGLLPSPRRLLSACLPTRQVTRLISDSPECRAWPGAGAGGDRGVQGPWLYSQGAGAPSPSRGLENPPRLLPLVCHSWPENSRAGQRPGGLSRAEGTLWEPAPRDRSRRFKKQSLMTELKCVLETDLISPSKSLHSLNQYESVYALWW